MKEDTPTQEKGTVTVPRAELSHLLFLAKKSVEREKTTLGDSGKQSQPSELELAIQKIEPFLNRPEIAAQAELEIQELTTLLGDQRIPEHEKEAINKILDECRKFDALEKQKIQAEIESLEKLLEDGDDQITGYEKRMLKVKIAGLRIRQSGESIPETGKTREKPDLPGRPL